MIFFLFPPAGLNLNKFQKQTVTFCTIQKSLFIIDTLRSSLNVIVISNLCGHFIVHFFVTRLKFATQYRTKYFRLYIQIKRCSISQNWTISIKRRAKMAVLLNEVRFKDISFHNIKSPKFENVSKVHLRCIPYSFRNFQIRLTQIVVNECWSPLYFIKLY